MVTINCSGKASQKKIRAEAPIPSDKVHSFSGYNTGTHGSQVAYNTPPFAEQSIVDGSGVAAAVPGTVGATINNRLGRSQLTADLYLNGAIDDLRIYNRVLSAGEVRDLVGAR